MTAHRQMDGGHTGVHHATTSADWPPDANPPPTKASAMFVPVEILCLYSDHFRLVFCRLPESSVCIHVHMNRHMCVCVNLLGRPRARAGQLLPCLLLTLQVTPQKDMQLLGQPGLLVDYTLIPGPENLSTEKFNYICQSQAHCRACVCACSLLCVSACCGEY